MDMEMGSERNFVVHRNDLGVPSDRKIEVIETGSKKTDGYPKVSIIIPTADAYRNGFFPTLLEQLSDQTFQDFEVIIIKGDSRQGRAINEGAGLSRGQYLLTLDDDTNLVSKDAFEKLVKVMESDNNIGMAGGINVIPGDASPFTKRAMSQIPRRATPEVSQVTDSDLAEHPLLMMRKDAFEEIGGENELMPRGLDPYLRSRFRRAGLRVVVVPGAYYTHLPPPTFPKLLKQFYRNGKQAGFCNKFFPEWLIETPDDHVREFVERRSFLYRAARYAVSMLRNSLSGRWIYTGAYIAYAYGFVWGYFRYEDASQI
jgi:glycosyltransferase involved in cell wall biosynthesis